MGNTPNIDKTLATLMRASPLPKLEKQMLWQHVMGVSRAWLIAHDTDTISSDYVQSYSSLEARRLNGEPMAYILGQREFMSHVFKVNANVLIPRPETELLVETALSKIENNANIHTITASEPKLVLDLGTGSGAVAVSIALARPDVLVFATDNSQQALNVAHLNATNLGANVEFFCGNWYDALPAGMDFDVILSNPPYIAAADLHLRQGDLRFEPQLALTDGSDGLSALRTIVTGAVNRLRKGGCLFVEHGWDQAPSVTKFLQQSSFKRIVTLADLAGISRITGGYF